MKETWGTWFYRRPTNPPNHLREWLGGIDSIEIVNLKIPWGLWFYRCIFRKRVRASRIIIIKLSTLSLNSKGDISAILWPMGFSRFPRKKRSIGLRCKPPMLAYISKSLCIHWLLSVVPPTKHTFSGSIPLPIIHFQHLALIHASFWGVTPPWFPYIFGKKWGG